MEELGDAKSVPKEAMDSIIIAPDEVVMNAWKASFKYPQPPGPPTTIIIGEMGGFLLLTNRRLAFVGTKGFLSISYFVALSISYEDVLGVECGGSSHAIRLSYKGALTPAVLSNFMEPSEPMTNILTERGAFVPSSKIKEILHHRIKSRLAEIEDEHERAPTQLVLDFTFLKSILEEGGIMVQAMKCPTCGASIDMPESGATIKCEYCGTNVRAVDLLERIKELIVASNSRSSN